jgi:hypothetical protein
MSVASAIIALRESWFGMPQLRAAQQPATLPAIYAAGIRVARTRTTYGARTCGRLLADRYDEYAGTV